jgi:SagB-type dehydrogenase family enzyme
MLAVMIVWGVNGSEDTSAEMIPPSVSPVRGDTIMLPDVPGTGAVSVEEAIWRRRSVRGFRREPLDQGAVSQLLWAAQGITEPVYGLRSAPSAGATYPLEIYIATGEHLARYLPDGHRIVVLHRRDVRGALAGACLDQEWVGEAPAVFIFVAEIARTAGRYGGRAERYVDIEVGCASENLMLQAAALGLGSVPVGAFEDDEVHDVLDLPKSWVPLLVVPVGVPAE